MQPRPHTCLPSSLYEAVKSERIAASHAIECKISFSFMKNVLTRSSERAHFHLCIFPFARWGNIESNASCNGNSSKLPRYVGRRRSRFSLYSLALDVTQAGAKTRLLGQLQAKHPQDTTTHTHTEHTHTHTERAPCTTTGIPSRSCP